MRHPSGVWSFGGVWSPGSATLRPGLPSVALRATSKVGSCVARGVPVPVPAQPIVVRHEATRWDRAPPRGGTKRRPSPQARSGSVRPRCYPGAVEETRERRHRADGDWGGIRTIGPVVRQFSPQRSGPVPAGSRRRMQTHRPPWRRGPAARRSRLWGQADRLLRMAPAGGRRPDVQPSRGALQVRRKPSHVSAPGTHGVLRGLCSANDPERIESASGRVRN